MKVTIGSYKFTSFSDAVSFAMRRYGKTRKEAEQYVRQLEIKQRSSDTQAKKQAESRMSSEMNKAFKGMGKKPPESKPKPQMTEKDVKAYERMDAKAVKQKGLESRMSAKMAQGFRNLVKETAEAEREVKRKFDTKASKGLWGDGKGGSLNMKPTRFEYVPQHYFPWPYFPSEYLL